MPSSARSLLGLVLLVFALVLALGACGGAAPESAAPMTVTPSVALAGAPPPAGEAQFAADVASPPPPKPQRQIDRDGNPEPPPPPPAELRKRELDKTVAATDSTNASTAEPAHDAQMLIYTAHVTMSVYQVAPALDAIEGIARAMGGYLESRNDTEIQIRIPRLRFDEALHKVEASGDVLHRDVTAQDVTDTYFDLEARLKNARAVRDRLQALLEKAAVKEAIDIQKELERVTGEIEVLEGKLKLLSSKIAYSTIDVAFQPRASAAVQLAPRLPFTWLGELGLPKLMNLESR
ncbi:MAG TPA: DUF4349 domain-containing protein [Polyangiaceae bacterium]|jgi:hypothetical protein|nr:DUF4349 domain-containing protein [Polyangiaceae bacterium]